MWDGSQPGWKLLRIDDVRYQVTFLFADAGPTAVEILGIRQTLDEFRNQPMQEVLKELRGKGRYVLPRNLTNLESRELVEVARMNGLKVNVDGQRTCSYLPVSPDKMAGIIEDYELATAVTERMIAAGVPIEWTHFD
jgi:hypothetical protein